MNTKTPKLLLFIALIPGCSALPSQGDRVLLGMGVGGTAGAIGGSVLSPNEESKGLNTIIFALSGAIAGGLIGFLSSSANETPKESMTLESKEQATAKKTKEYVVAPQKELPDFLKNRMSPAVVEEFIEADQIGEDGSLHSPHKVYRIKHQAELLARPDPNKKNNN